MKNRLIEGAENIIFLFCFWMDGHGFVRIVNLAVSLLHDELERKSQERESERKTEIIVMMVTICVFMTLFYENPFARGEH